MARITKHVSRITHHASRITLFAFGLIFLLALALPVVAQDTVTDDEVNEIAREVYCPVCESTPLDVCQTQACADWREVIRTKLSEGQSKEEIFNYFASQYGDRVLAEPPRRGFNLILWVLPVVAILVGVVFFARYVRGLRKAAEPAPALAGNGPAFSQPGDDNEYIAQVEKELQNR